MSAQRSAPAAPSETPSGRASLPACHSEHSEESGWEWVLPRGSGPGALHDSGDEPAAQPYHPWRAAALCAGAAAALAVVFLFDPASAGFYPPCSFRLLTGLLCPGCGATRALHQLLHGRAGAALALNPLLPLYLAILGWFFLAELGFALGRPRLAIPFSGRLSPSRWAWALLALVLAFWVLRNLPGSPLGAAAT